MNIRSIAMKKILVVGDFISGSGLTQVIFNVFSHLPSSDYAITAIGYGKDTTGFTDDKCRKLGWKLYRVVPVTKNPIKHWRWWRHFFLHHKFDVLYFNYSSSWNYLPVVYAKKYSNAKIVCHSHNSYFSHTFSNKLLMSILIALNNHGKHIFDRYADVKIATSGEAGKWMFGDNAQNVRVVINGIDLEKFTYTISERKQIRTKLGLNKETKLIGFVGVLQKRKNPLLAIEVFAGYHHMNSNSKLIMLGKGPLKSVIQDKIHNLHLDNDVIQYDFVADIYHWYSAMDAMLFTSEYEGFGLVAVEAQISNLPVLASDTNIETIFATNNIHKINGLDIQNWVGKLNRTLSQSVDRNGIDPNLQEFSVERQALVIQKLIK